MLVLKHVEYEISDVDQLNGLIAHLNETTSKIEGIKLLDIYFPKIKKEFVLFLECKNEQAYYDWRKICPPPDGAQDWYEVFFKQSDKFS
ncbi:MAG: hypothetical protein ACFFAS_07085 [Promethearchaeota archaeon]